MTLNAPGLGFLLFEMLFLALLIVVVGIIVALVSMTYGILWIILILFIVFVVIAIFNPRVSKRYFPVDNLQPQGLSAPPRL